MRSASGPSAGGMSDERAVDSHRRPSVKQFENARPGEWYPEDSAAPATTAAKDRRPIVESQSEFRHRRLLRHRLEISIDLHLDSPPGLTTFNQLFYIPMFDDVPHYIPEKTQDSGDLGQYSQEPSDINRSASLFRRRAHEWLCWQSNCTALFVRKPNRLRKSPVQVVKLDCPKALSSNCQTSIKETR